MTRSPLPRVTFPVLVVLATAALGGGTAAAQPRDRQPPPRPAQPPASPAPVAPSDQAMQRAHDAYDRGRSLFQAGQWAEALAAFREAHTAQPHPTVLLSIAECQDRIGSVRDAVATLEQYLTEMPGARDREAVAARVAAMRARPATLHLTSDPSGARIEIDGRDTDLTTPADLELPPGAHAIRLRLDGHVDREEQLTLEFAERRELAATLPAEAAPPSPEPSPPPPPPRVARSFTATFVAAGLTGAALITGAILGALTLSTKADFDDAPTWDLANRGDRLALATDVAFGFALAAGLTTAFAWAAAAASDDTPPTRVAGLGSGLGLSF